MDKKKKTLKTAVNMSRSALSLQLYELISSVELFYLLIKHAITFTAIIISITLCSPVCNNASFILPRCTVYLNHFLLNQF